MTAWEVIRILIEHPYWSNKRTADFIQAEGLFDVDAAKAEAILEAQINPATGKGWVW